MHRVSAIIVHELYNTPVRDNDVAVVLLSSAATLSNSVAIASIPLQGAVVPDNSTVVAVGWGRTSVSTNFSLSFLIVGMKQVYLITSFGKLFFWSKSNGNTIVARAK